MRFRDRNQARALLLPLLLAVGLAGGLLLASIPRPDEEPVSTQPVTQGRSLVREAPDSAKAARDPLAMPLWYRDLLSEVKPEPRPSRVSTAVQQSRAERTAPPHAVSKGAPPEIEAGPPASEMVTESRSTVRGYW